MTNMVKNIDYKSCLFCNRLTTDRIGHYCSLKRAYMRLSSTEYEEEAQRCSCYCNEQAVAYLENALCKAQKAAYAVENTPDGGASNFDEVILVTSVKKYDLHAMDINLELVAKDTYSVDFNLNGQGERRTAMAQAACKALQKSGYKAYVKYILD